MSMGRLLLCDGGAAVWFELITISPNDGIWHTSLFQTQVFESSSLSSGTSRSGGAQCRLLQDSAEGGCGVTAGLTIVQIVHLLP